jgi:gamma-glutamyltranspeptidase / glutathione hydrolase
VVDKDRNCVSLIQSNYFGFGSKLVARRPGLRLQNRGTLFALDEKHLNRWSRTSGRSTRSSRRW